MIRFLTFLTLVALGACDRSPKQAPKASETTQPVAPGAPGAALDASVVATPAAPPPAADAGPPPAFLGVLRGAIRLAKGAKLPLAPPVTVNGKSPVAVAPCPPIDLHDQKTIAAHDSTGGLSPVHVAVTGMRVAPERAPVLHEIFIDACRLRPTLVGAMRGDKVRVTNRSDAPLLPVLPGDKFMQGLVRGESREFEVNKLGPNVVACGFSNYCGESAIITLSHPLYDVSDAQGSYTIERVPLDEELTLHAWHPLFEVTSVPFKLSRDEPAKTIDLVLTPTPSPAPERRAPPKQSKPAKGAKKPPQD